MCASCVNSRVHLTTEVWRVTSGPFGQDQVSPNQQELQMEHISCLGSL